MTHPSLSNQDLDVLGKIQDPEWEPSRLIQVDELLPKDPNVTDPTEYERIAMGERRIILAVQQAELQLAALPSEGGPRLLDTYNECVAGLSALILANPSYASAKNNRAQANRRLYGDGMLVAKFDSLDGPPIVTGASVDERLSAANQTLWDLDTCISLLTPAGPCARLSRQSMKTLSSAHTQRAALYHQTSKILAAGGVLDVDPNRKEARWNALDFEDSASQGFALGGKYGNEIAKGLAVSVNPTAKLCGQMVREAMRKEYGPSFSG